MQRDNCFVRLRAMRRGGGSVGQVNLSYSIPLKARLFFLFQGVFRSSLFTLVKPELKQLRYFKTRKIDVKTFRIKQNAFI